jgi:hypothetical protein
MEKLTLSIENTEKRAKVLENKVSSLKSDALLKRKNKDNRGNFISYSMNSDVF